MSDEIWVRVCATTEFGFWRAGLFWPRTPTIRKVDQYVAARLFSEPRLVVTQIPAPADPPIAEEVEAEILRNKRPSARRRRVDEVPPPDEEEEDGPPTKFYG